MLQKGYEVKKGVYYFCALTELKKMYFVKGLLAGISLSCLVVSYML